MNGVIGVVIGTFIEPWIEHLTSNNHTPTMKPLVLLLHVLIQ